MGTSILKLRQKPQLYEERVLEAHQLASSIEEAAKRAGMNQQQIESIRPQPPRRVQQSAYVESVTRVRLQDVSMRQLVELLWQLDRQVRGLAIPELRLWDSDEQANRWQVELGLAGLAYLPSESPNIAEWSPERTQQ